ncbi:DAP3-binding cell death enhancer 1-like [Pollicipes pollicipes]|uniref:DAP3-binding cell death enhancer 1-like n=1 Tax=Pollicipes pollicipes TaxID=41117 RepID=UPI001884B362|nr:DAP3-binding cell death enhancer 1-like [Pollicipes pollicipes]
MANLQNAAGAGVAASRPKQALECFRRAAALGSPSAWFNTGVCFQQGLGTRVDVEKAAVCYEEAVRLGHAAAAYNLALLLAGGAVLSTCDVTDLLRRAADGGCAEAAAFLHTWCRWCDDLEDGEAEDGGAVPSPPGRSVSLPTLADGWPGCGSGAGRPPTPGRLPWP